MTHFMLAVIFAWSFFGKAEPAKPAAPDTEAITKAAQAAADKAVKELTILNPVAPTLYGNTTFGTSSYYIGYTNRNTRTNKFYIPAGATGYDEGYWKSYLYSSSYCGFTKEEIAE
jgi:hypothetical protein